MARNDAKGPKFVRYFGPVIEVLKSDPAFSSLPADPRFTALLPAQ